jgi:predicted ATP-grasp superfamily ATP-dependent carboligase
MSASIASRLSTQIESPPALILGDDPVNTLGVARNLGRNGVTVYRLGETESGVLGSRFIRSTWVISDIGDCSNARFVEHLERIAKDIGAKPVLFPITDIHVLRVASNAAVLSDNFLLLASDLATTETLVNKRLFFESLVKCGVPHPATRYPRGHSHFERAAADIGYPVLLKPEISPLFAKKYKRKGFVAHDEKELFFHLRTLASSGIDVMVQEIIPGDATCMHGCAGLRTAADSIAFCYRRVREFPPGFGCGSLLKSIPSIVDETRVLEYLEGIGYTGIFDAEFKLDPRDGVYKVIEINARSWWQNLHPTISGLNVIQAAYEYALGRPVERQDYRLNTKWIHLYNDYFAAQDAGLGLLAWLRTIRGERAFDILASDDVKPMISYMSGIFLGKLTKMFGIRNRA